MTELIDIWEAIELLSDKRSDCDFFVDGQTAYEALSDMIKAVKELPRIDLVRCGECKQLEVINKAPIYAHCHKWNYDFELWQEDTRTNFCSWAERRADEHNTERD